MTYKKLSLFYKFTEESTTAPAPVTIIKSTNRPSSTRARPRPTRPGPTTIRAITDSDILNKIKQQNSGRTPTRTIRPITDSTEKDSTTSHIPHIIVAGHPHENEISSSNVNVRQSEAPNVNIPLSVDGERRQPFGAKLNLGAIIALGAFGGFVFLAAIITTIVILVRR